MEFPDLGAHCSMPFCNKLDFLPVKCDCCLCVFCYEHMRYDDHRCTKSGTKNVQVPICPLCNKPVPSKRHEAPDIAVSAHIDRECESDPAVGRRKVYTNKCSMHGCRKKEMVPFLCSECKLNFCIGHRHPSDHECRKRSQSEKLKTNGSLTISSLTHTDYGAIQGNMDEDEALARALALSYEEDLKKNIVNCQGDNFTSNVSTNRCSRNDSSHCRLS